MSKNTSPIAFRDFQRAQKKAGEWKKKATERREELEALKIRINTLETTSAKNKESVEHLQKTNASLQEEVFFLRRQLEISNQTLEKIKIENEELKKKAFF